MIRKGNKLTARFGSYTFDRRTNEVIVRHPHVTPENWIDTIQAIDDVLTELYDNAQEQIEDDVLAELNDQTQEQIKDKLISS